MYCSYILVRRKWIFCGQLHVIAQCFLHIKRLRKMVLCVVFAAINKGRVKTVITVCALVANKVWKWIMLQRKNDQSRTNVLFTSYLQPKKIQFWGANTRYCTMFTTGEKFDKDGSVHTFARISKGRAKTVITVLSLLWLQLKCKYEICFRSKTTKVEQIYYLLRIWNEFATRANPFLWGQIFIFAASLVRVKMCDKSVFEHHICLVEQIKSKCGHYRFYLMCKYGVNAKFYLKQIWPK